MPYVQKAGQQAERVEQQTGNNPHDQLYGMVEPLYNNYTVGGPGGWTEQPMNPFATYPMVLRINLQKKDAKRDHDFLRQAWLSMKKSVHWVCEQYFKSGQNADAEQIDPKEFWNITGPHKGNGSYGCPNAEVFYVFLMVLQYPHLRNFTCDTLDEVMSFNGNLRFDGAEGFCTVAEPPHFLEAGPRGEDEDATDNEDDAGEEEETAGATAAPQACGGVFASPRPRAPAAASNSPAPGSSGTGEAPRDTDAGSGSSSNAAGKQSARSTAAAGGGTTNSSLHTNSAFQLKSQFMGGGGSTASSASSNHSSLKRKLAECTDLYMSGSSAARDSSRNLVTDLKMLHRLYAGHLKSLSRRNVPAKDVERLERDKEHTYARIEHLTAGIDALEAASAAPAAAKVSRNEAASGSASSSSAPPVLETLQSTSGATPPTPSSSMESMDSAGVCTSYLPSRRIWGDRFNANASSCRTASHSAAGAAPPLS
eukprot:2062867-Rhodomonas_salina.2